MKLSSKPRARIIVDSHRPVPITPEEIISLHDQQLRERVRRINAIVLKVELCIIIPGMAWIAWRVLEGLARTGMLPW